MYIYIYLYVCVCNSDDNFLDIFSYAQSSLVFGTEKSCLHIYIYTHFSLYKKFFNPHINSCSYVYIYVSISKYISKMNEHRFCKNINTIIQFHV
jgi:hypothetical protein